MKLFEGMRHGDLEDLVLPMISVDEYESKLDETAIVIGFYVHDKDAADDLNRFIQKSAVELLDSEVSPAPDQHGYYLVFVEILNDIKIVDNIETILQEVSPLIADDSWQMQIRGVDEVLDFSRRTLSKRFAHLRGEAQKNAKDDDETDRQVVEFLSHSDLQSALCEDDRVKLSSVSGSVVGEFVGFGEIDTLMVENSLEHTPISLEFSDVSESKYVSQILGENWVASRVGDILCLQRSDTVTALLIRNAKFV